ncbi:hypothetical protein DM02DRAFT_159629 [Periconia macrospinosa]|uniref:Uncharacterized protein n=1 Tax=Periconia macrospinosa TaxID=97972 RepID=A0A2V1E2B5_9PLEO|nr:hypothetical protein DM02DRAFT_159629 [Periconia macrospinosa]
MWRRLRWTGTKRNLGFEDVATAVFMYLGILHSMQNMTRSIFDSMMLLVQQIHVTGSQVCNIITEM